MEPLTHGTVRFRHFGDRGKHLFFAVNLECFRFHLLGARSHRGAFLVRESLAPLLDCLRTLGGLLSKLHGRSSSCARLIATYPHARAPARVMASRKLTELATRVMPLRSATGPGRTKGASGVGGGYAE